jgi:hypothetical protein
MVLYLRTCDMAGALTIDFDVYNVCSVHVHDGDIVITEKMYVMVDDGGML